MLTLFDVVMLITVGLGVAALMSWVAWRVRGRL